MKIDIPQEPLVPLESYLNVNAPFDEFFRKSDSFWSLATEVELKAGLEWWKDMVERGEAEKILE